MVASFLCYDVQLIIRAPINLLKKMKHVKVNYINCLLSKELACGIADSEDNACENEEIPDQILCNAVFRTFFEPLFFYHPHS